MKRSDRWTDSHRYGVALLYLFSGASALMYEIIWARMLGQIVGTAVTAWAAVLVAYMGGMALGSFAGGRLADRTSRPLHVFALFECGIGLFGMVSPALLRGIPVAFAALPPLPGVQTAAAVATLTFPTVLMGATFPLVGRVLTTDARPAGSAIALLYTANVIGAVIGTVAVGFFFMPTFGMRASIHVAAVINMAVAAAALVWYRSKTAAGGETEYPAGMMPSVVEPRAPQWLFPAVLACTGFCTMAFEVLWSRALVFFLTSTTYSFTVVLSVVLAGLAAGGLAATLIARRKHHAAWIAALQIGIGIYGFATLFFLQGLDAIVHCNDAQVTNVWWHWVGVRYAACIALIFPAAFCMGATYPLAIGASCRSLQTTGHTIGTLASLNTIGGIAGSLAAAFVLIPFIGIQRSLVIVAMINCLAGLTVMRWGMRVAGPRVVAGIIAVSLVCAGILHFSDIRPMIFYSHILRKADTPIALLAYQEDQTASVAVLQTRQSRTLTIDGFNAAGTYKYEYMHLLAHLPVLLSPSPDSVLVICFGSGTTCGSVAIHPQVRRVDCVEISPAVVAAARYFNDVNHHAADHPKVHLSIGDGRQYLLRTRRHFDCITLEPMLPFMASATNLYSADFYRLCRSRLTERGVMAQWAPMHALSKREYRMLIGTFASVFPHASLWLLGSEAILIGTMQPLRIDIPSLEARMAQDELTHGLARISITDPARLLSCFLMGEEAIREFVGKVPVICDDRHSLEFSAPHNRVLPLSRMWVDNMNELLRNRSSVIPYLKPSNDSIAVRINQYCEASSLIMRANILNATGDAMRSLLAADEALHSMPDDTTAKIIRREAASNVVAMLVRRARQALDQKDPRSAEQFYLQALAVDSSNVTVLSELAQLYIGLERYDDVVAYARKAVAASPDDPSTHTNLAVVYLNLDRLAEAEQELLQALALDKTFGRAYYFLHALYERTGRRAEATNAWRKIQELGYRE